MFLKISSFSQGLEWHYGDLMIVISSEFLNKTDVTESHISWVSHGALEVLMCIRVASCKVYPENVWQGRSLRSYESLMNPSKAIIMQWSTRGRVFNWLYRTTHWNHYWLYFSPSCFKMAHQPLRHNRKKGKFYKKKKWIEWGVHRNNPSWRLLGKRGCRGRGGCLHGGLLTRSSRVDEVTLFLLCSSARGLSACHYGWFSQLARTRNSALEREKLTALENGGKRREIQEEEE